MRKRYRELAAPGFSRAAPQEKEGSQNGKAENTSQVVAGGGEPGGQRAACVQEKGGRDQHAGETEDREWRRHAAGHFTVSQPGSIPFFLKKEKSVFMS